MLTNGYTNIENKNSFSIEVITCNELWRENGDACASEEDINEFISHLMITQYLLQETI